MLDTPVGSIPKSPAATVQPLAEAAGVKPETFALPYVAARIGVHPQTARAWVRRGVFPPPVIKVGRVVRWSGAQIEKFVSEGVTA